MSPTKPAGPVPRTSAIAQALIEKTIETALEGGAPWVRTVAAPPAIEAAIDNVIANERQLSYRDALVVQLAFWLATGKPTDIQVRQEGGRSVAGQLGRFLADKHIHAVRDAFQNIGKNTENLARGNFPDFDRVLGWGAEASRSKQEIESAFRYVCVRIAKKSRPISSMPKLNVGALTFAKVAQLLDRLYAAGSGGAFEQFSIAALLQALFEQQALSEYRIGTKNLNASDKSSSAAGDIQIFLRNRVVEAIEVTANDWRSKLPGATKTIKEYDLSRLTILGSRVSESGPGLYAELQKQDVDLSVLETSCQANSMISALTRQSRAAALQRLYELLDRHQPRVDITNQYVALLHELGLAEAS